MILELATLYSVPHFNMCHSPQPGRNPAVWKPLGPTCLKMRRIVLFAEYAKNLELDATGDGFSMLCSNRPVSGHKFQPRGCHSAKLTIVQRINHLKLEWTTVRYLYCNNVMHWVPCTNAHRDIQTRKLKPARINRDGDADVGPTGCRCSAASKNKTSILRAKQALACCFDPCLA